MIELVFAAGDAVDVRQQLLDGSDERCAVLFANEVCREDGSLRLLVRDIEYPVEHEYSRRGPLEAQLKPDFVARVAKRALREGSTLIFAHSHLGGNAPQFSKADDAGELHLAKFLSRRVPNLAHAALVISEGGVSARLLGTAVAVRVVSLGLERQIIFDPELDNTDLKTALYDRQLRAFGESGQRAIQNLRVAVVGLGGTGSLVVEQLAHLGVHKFILIDPDVVEATNLNRVANATDGDIDVPKVNVAARYIRQVQRQAEIELVPGNVIEVKHAKRLVQADLIFGCTDSHGSRAILGQIAYQFLVPLIDMGVVIAADEARVKHVIGRVQLLTPGLPCFVCGGLLNSDLVRRDMMTAFERQQDPYIIGAHEPAPAVMSINGTTASLAVTMMLSVVAGFPTAARHILYNGLASTVRPVGAERNPDCYVCSHAGALARGYSWPIFGRENQ
jgi:hypothetical protein